MNHTANNAQDASKQSMQTNTGAGENLPLQKRAWMKRAERFSNLRAISEDLIILMLILIINNVCNYDPEGRKSLVGIPSEGLP